MIRTPIPPVAGNEAVSEDVGPFLDRVPRPQRYERSKHAAQSWESFEMNAVSIGVASIIKPASPNVNYEVRPERTMI